MDTRTGLFLFGMALETTRRLYIAPISARTLFTRALAGLAADPMLQNPVQKGIVAATTARVAAMDDNDRRPLAGAFTEALDDLQKTPSAPPLDALLRTALSGMLDGLDRDTRFLLEGQVAADPNGSIGLVIRNGLHGPTVTRTLPSSPASQSDIRRGEEIVSVDGRSVTGLSLSEVVRLLMGPVGSRATLVLQRPGTSMPYTMRLTRQSAHIQPVLVQNLDGTAYVRIELFQAGTANALRSGFTSLKADANMPLKGVVLDLRDNLGGILGEATAVAGDFMPAGRIVATTTDRGARENVLYAASGGDIADGLPMVVLVNAATAGGAEIAAGALRDGRGAMIMGEHTVGYGVVRTVIPFAPLGAVALVTGEVMFPSGRRLSPAGLLPDVGLGLGREDSAEQPTSNPLVQRLRRELRRGTEDAPFDDSNTPQLDPEVAQASAALAIMQRSGS